MDITSATIPQVAEFQNYPFTVKNLTPGTISRIDKQITQMRAHDVRAVATSLAVKGGISLEQVLSSCYWKSLLLL